MHILYIIYIHCTTKCNGVLNQMLDLVCIYAYYYAFIYWLNFGFKLDTWFHSCKIFTLLISFIPNLKEIQCSLIQATCFCFIIPYMLVIRDNMIISYYLIEFLITFIFLWHVLLLVEGIYRIYFRKV